MALSQKALREEYKKYENTRILVTRDLETQLEKKFSRLGSRILVKGRVKNFASYYKKYINILKDKAGGVPETARTHPETPPVITDLIGLRVVCPFLEDMKEVEKIISGAYEVVELDHKGAGYSFKEFGYESTHFLVAIPPHVLRERGDCGCRVAEIQIRTILQDAWAEVEHELVYKAEFSPFDEPMKRKLAALNASLSLADTIFQEIRGYQRQLNRQLGKRRDSFYRKIAESTDALLVPDLGMPVEDAEPGLPEHSGGNVDDILLNALYAHNNNRFTEAIGFYSRILEMKIADSIRSLIHKHRGMAYFAQSMYQDAIDDFSSSLEWDKASYKAAYYRGVVWSVMQHYPQAVDDFSLSLDINPYQAFCLFRRGQAYYHIGDYPAALADCEASLDLEPDNEGAHKLRELVQRKLRM
ncbi:MAG: tetratricopeptide repeat protein [Treponema sp.]|jgi:putative GTP pyrophosphokinase|nr:tetratricopeptide repeat protein [Treponema sp.]